MDSYRSALISIIRMALFVVNNIRPLKFHLLGLPRLEYNKYKKLIIDNGGEVSITGSYPVINFSMPGCFPKDKMVFHVCYIEECIKENRILDLVDFSISDENDYEGCPLSTLIFGNPRCKLAVTPTPFAMLKNNGCSQHNNTNDDTDENESTFLIESDESFINSSYERRSRNENVPNIVDKLYTDYKISKDYDINIITDDISDNSENITCSLPKDV